MSSHTLWVEKYRPTSFNDYIVKDPNLQAFINDVRDTKVIPHLMLSGVQGTGKTTLARLLIEVCEVDEIDVKRLNASDDNSVDIIRNVVKPFSTIYPNGAFKVVLLEEANRLTPEAQEALKVLMEEQSEYVRFIFTTNQPHKIIPPLRSRVQEYQFDTMDQSRIVEYVANILFAENIDFDPDLILDYVQSAYPDVRKTVQLLQQHSSGGVLRPLHEKTNGSALSESLIPLISAGDWVGARTLLCSDVSKGEWESVFRLLYTNIDKCPGFEHTSKWDEAILIIQEHLVQHTLCADPEINVAAMVIKLSQLAQSNN